MNDTDYKYFKTRKGGKNVGIFVAAFSMFPIMGVVALVMGEIFAGILVLGFGTLIIGYLIFRAVALGWKYGVGRQGVLLKAYSAIREIPFSELKSVSVLEQDKLDRFLKFYSNKILASQRSMSIKKWYQSSKVLGEVTRFVSVVVTESQAGRGGPMAVNNLNVQIEGPVVILETVNNEYFLITPEDSRGFASRVRSGGVEGTPVDGYFPSGFTSIEAESSASGKRPLGTLRKIMIINAVVVIVAAAGFFIWFAFAGPGSSGAAGEQDAESGELSLPVVYGVWQDESLFFLGVPAETLADFLEPGASVEEDLPFQKGDMVPSLRFLVVDGMVFSFRYELGKEPEDFDREALADYLFMESEIRYYERMVHETGESEMFSVYGDTLQQHVYQVLGYE